MHTNPHMYNPMAYPPEGMMPNNPGFVMNYMDPNMQMQPYMDPRDQMPRDRNQGGYPMKKSYPRSDNYGGYHYRGSQRGGKPMSSRGGPRNEHYQKYGERKFRQSYQYGDEGGEDDYSQGKLLPQSKKISKYPRDQGRRYEGPRGYYDDQGYMQQDYHDPSKPRRRQSIDDQKGLNPSMFFKTKMCPHLQNGVCTRGPSCSYAHTQSELRDPPNLKKTRLCQQFLSGKCTRGNSCSFAHGEEELRATPEFFKTSLCNSYLKGNCRAGEHCRYAHGNEELRQNQEKSEQGINAGYQAYDMSMYRPQYNMSEYDLSSYQIMEPNSLDMQNNNVGNNMPNPLNYSVPTMESNLNPNFENKKPDMASFESDSNKKSEIVPQNSQNTFVNTNFNEYVHNSDSRKNSANKPVSPQVENPDNIAFNTFNPEKINSLLSSNQQNGNF